MAVSQGRLDVLLIGGGMISEEVILPTLFQERARGLVGRISVATRRAATIKHLRKCFPAEPFDAYPNPSRVPAGKSYPDSYRKALAKLKPTSAVIVATPDHLHTKMTLEAVEAGHHVVVQKPLCLKVDEAEEIQKAAAAAGAYVYTDYHKRHDRAIRLARQRFRKGDFGQMLYAQAWIEERREMPLKHFARWCEQSSSFEYIGVHYADAYHFITGLKPTKLVAFGQKKLLPSLGKDAYDAVQATIVWEDESVLWIQTSWVASQSHSALTRQGMYLHGTQGEYWADHKNRNMEIVTEGSGFEQVNPNFFKPVNDWDDPDRIEWVGYGYDSIKQGVDDIRTLRTATRGLSSTAALAKRKRLIARWKATRPLPQQAKIGTAINEAVRLSIDHTNAWVGFDKKMRLGLM